MTDTKLSDKQQAGLRALQVAGGNAVVLHVGIGGALVKAGFATKDTTSGHGKLKAAYRLVK